MELNKRAKLQIGLLLLPGVLIFGTFTVYPIFRLFLMSFFQWDFGSFFNQSFIALENYKAVLSDKYFYTAFGNTAAYALVTVPAQMLFGFIVALMIHSVPRGKILFRVAYYLPVITSWVIASLIFKYIFNTEGLLNYVLRSIFHLTRQNIHWLDTRWGGMTVAMLLGIWKGVGWNMVVFLAALHTVPKELYEAAELDGASGWAKFLNVTLPGIKGTILFATVMLTIGGFNVYTSTKLITDGKPAHSTEVILTWMYYKAFSTGKFGYAAALSFIMAAVLAVLAFVQFRLMKSEE